MQSHTCTLKWYNPERAALDNYFESGDWLLNDYISDPFCTIRPECVV